MKQRITRAYQKLKGTNIISNFFNLSSIQISNIVLLILIIRIVTGRVGIIGFGMITYAYRFSILGGTMVNYGTNQTAVRDIAFHRSDNQLVGKIVSHTLVIRAIAFVAYILCLYLLCLFNSNSANYLLLAAPVVFAEVINPLAFFTAVEKLRVFNILNLAVNIMVLAAIYLFIDTPAHAGWCNFIIGLGNVLTYLILLGYFLKRFGVRIVRPDIFAIKHIAKENFHLIVNGICTNLQQSSIIFMLNWYNPLLLGAYSLADRIITQCRALLIIVSYSFYPKAAAIYQNSLAKWNIYRRKIKFFIAGSALAGALMILFSSDWIIFLLSGKPDTDSALILRVMCLVLIITAFNVFSVIDIALKNQMVYLSAVSVILALIAIALAFFIVRSYNNILTGAFTIIIEGLAMIFYELKIKRTDSTAV